MSIWIRKAGRAQGDFREGIRAAIIDKDKAPQWTHATLVGPAPEEVTAILALFGEDEWTWKGLQ